MKHQPGIQGVGQNPSVELVIVSDQLATPKKATGCRALHQTVPALALDSAAEAACAGPAEKGEFVWLRRWWDLLFRFVLRARKYDVVFQDGKSEKMFPPWYFESLGLCLEDC